MASGPTAVVINGGCMAKKDSIGNDYVKKNTMVVFSLVALAAGFLGGIVLSAYKSSSIAPAPAPAVSQQQSVTQQGPSAEDAQKILALEKMVAENPQDVDSWIRLGNVYFDTAQHQKAIQAYEKSLALSPKNANVLTDLGVMYRRSGKPEKAIESFDRAMQADPLHEVSRLNKGIVLMHDLNDLQGAVKAWEELLKINPTAKTASGMMVKDIIEKMKKPAG